MRKNAQITRFLSEQGKWQQDSNSNVDKRQNQKAVKLARNLENARICNRFGSRNCERRKVEVCRVFRVVRKPPESCSEYKQRI